MPANATLFTTPSLGVNSYEGVTRLAGCTREEQVGNSHGLAVLRINGRARAGGESGAKHERWLFSGLKQTRREGDAERSFPARHRHRSVSSDKQLEESGGKQRRGGG
ncbi:hypothetical protein EYF80_055140 [Liparis tanakae]|uniref:Uncharacterized protein n=1 Tax=Liparis tanakae TaxID=230148 RepID=A0A4Z2F1Q9_9TELE|nr:hypothetical protein EYF80_055140 [Liparis tanakae]